MAGPPLVQEGDGEHLLSLQPLAVMLWRAARKWTRHLIGLA
jgi:hypothetical protein